jgi:hypothetical protein
MDPYLVIECNGQKHQTKVHHGGGKYPVWNQVGIGNIFIDFES